MAHCKSHSLTSADAWSRWLVAILVLACAACTSTGGPASGSGERGIATRSSGPASSPDQRIALVIGNSKYAESPLINPTNDARAMTEALTSLGFNVTHLHDATLQQMNDAARQFGDRLRAGGVGLFFYAGHGMQIRGKNFLIPVGSDIKREDEVQYKAFDANQLLDKMESAKNPINIVILDACRNNPFARSFRSSATGLAQMEAPVGTYVAFSTAPGRVASDGDGANGLFTQHLLTSLRTPGRKVEDIFKQVRIGVMQDSGGQQIPWDSSSLTGDFYFARADSAAPPARPAESGTRVVQQSTRPAPSSDSANRLAQQSQSTSSAAVPSPPVGPVQQTSRPSPPPAPASPAASALSTQIVPAMAATNQKTEPPAAESSKPARAPARVTPPEKAPTTEKMMLAKANTAPATTPPAVQGGDDAYKRGLEAYKKGEMQSAYDLFAQAADQGNAGAQYEVAMFQKSGRNPVKQDVAAARRWFTRAAEQNNTNAQYELGQMYEQGVGGEKSCKDAEKWFRRAAEKSHTEAMMQLGWVYLRGCAEKRIPPKRRSG